MSQLLQPGDKVYYIDYSDSNKSYTIVEVREIQENKFQKGGLCYIIHADSLSNMTGYYTISTDSVDNTDIHGRFYSTPERATEAYEKFQTWVKEKEKNN